MTKQIQTVGEDTKKTLRAEIKDAIRFVGIDKKMSGGWNDGVLDPITDEIIGVMLDKVRNMNTAVGAVPLVKNLIWELEAK